MASFSASHRAPPCSFADVQRGGWVVVGTFLQEVIRDYHPGVRIDAAESLVGA